MRARSARLLLAALVAGATGMAGAACAGAAVEVAGAAGAIGLIRSTSCQQSQTRGTCVQLSCIQLDRNVRRELAEMASMPPIACAPAAPVVVAPVQIVVETPPPAPPVRRAQAVLPFAPKTSPPTYC